MSIPKYLEPFFWRSSYADGDKGRIVIPGHKAPDLIMLLNWHTALEDCHRGTLLINDEMFEVVGPPGEECVTSGKFRVVLEKSYKFDRILPELKDVPGRTEIKFHGFNYGNESEGCIGPGRTGGINYVNDSWEAVDEIVKIMEEAEKNSQSVWIEIIEPEGKTMFKEALRKILSKIAPDRVEHILLDSGSAFAEKILSDRIKEKFAEGAESAIELLGYAKDPELAEKRKAAEDAIMAYSEAIKQHAVKTKTKLDDKPAAMLDSFVDGFVKAVRGNPIF